MTAPILVFTDFKKPFWLETDASWEGLGPVLLQESDNGQYHPVAYASRELKGGEPKYHSSKLEFLALKWVVTEQFRKYLQYQPFTVWTDNNQLTYILTTPNLDALGHRWVAALAGYNMKLEYLKGSDNKIADTLSRLPPEKLNEEAIAELLDYARVSHKPRAEMANINVLGESEQVDKKVIVRYTQIVKQHKNFRNLANLDWVEAQSRDPVIPAVINWIKQPRGDKRMFAEYLTGVASEYEKHLYAARQWSLLFRTTSYTSRLLPRIARIPHQFLWSQPMTDRQLSMDATVPHAEPDEGTLLVARNVPGSPESHSKLRKCIQYEAKGQLPPMQPIICTDPWNWST